jgi:hypothetical protein
MIYRTFDDLCRAIHAEMQGMTTKQEIRDSETLHRLAKLVSIYMDAESNPPDGVIGVGCITYAEQMLQAAQ